MVKIPAAARKAAESLYSDVCDVYIAEKKTDGYTNLTYFEERCVCAGLSCRLSYERQGVTGGDPAALVSQSAKLLLSPDVSIQAGSKLAVLRGATGETLFFKGSGQPAVYVTHQEITLEPWSDYS